MKKEKRIVYLELANEINAALCTFCSQSRWESDGCCDGYAICEHPLSDRCCWPWFDESPEPSDDCWGFKPAISVETAADIVGAIISQEYDEWGMMVYTRRSVTVYGRDTNGQTSKVRIGYNGPPMHQD